MAGLGLALLNKRGKTMNRNTESKTISAKAKGVVEAAVAIASTCTPTMAVVVGPLFSQEARGQFGKSVVYGRRRGQNVVRQYGVPSNPESDNQIAVRISLAIGGLVSKRVRATNWTYAGETMTWIMFWSARVRTGEVWNSAMVRAMMGPNRINYTETKTQYDALDTPTQTLWQTAATNATAGLVDYVRGDTTDTAGFQLFLAEKTIAAAGYGDPFNEDTPTAIAAG